MIAFLIFVVLAQTDMTPLDETASRHGEANPDEADETPEPTTEIISPNVLETRSLTRARRNLLREQKKVLLKF